MIYAIHAQEKILLYPRGASETNGIIGEEQFLRKDFVVKISEARMYFYPANKSNNTGTAVLICPGGGYSGVSAIKEGEEVAQWFNSLGVTAFVLYYRMPNGYHAIPFKDARTALDIINKRSKGWKINKSKIGIMGFSAGGHLAATVGTQMKGKNRPKFMILGYPVITMQSEYTHRGSRQNLLGKSPDESLVTQYSAELQVSKKTPPTFLFHAEDDKTVPIQNSRLFADSLKAKGVPFELYTFPEGGHGIGLRPTNPEADKWAEMLAKWMKKMGLLE
ncbi:alpha/beta hydrolase [Paludibacter sp.]